MAQVSIIIPSRTQPRQAQFLNRVLANIDEQTVRGKVDLEILIGLDQGASQPADLVASSGVRFVEGYARSQVAALNSALRASTGETIAFLEDDDRWHPNYLELMLDVLDHADFVTTNQLVVDERDQAIGVSDFPTPSAWVFKRTTWTEVGAFDDSYKWHFDVDWLGRVRERAVRRIHLVEAGVPLSLETLERSRPKIAQIMTRSAGALLAKHELPSPLILRMRHPLAGMEQIAANAEAGARSALERELLIARYGDWPC